MKNNPLVLIVGLTFFCMLIYFGIQTYIGNRQSAYMEKLAQDTDQQYSFMYTLAQNARTNTSNEIIDSYVRDCKTVYRSRFDALLAKPTKTTQEKYEFDILFSACASYFSDRKTAVIASLQREFSLLTVLVDHMALFSEESTEIYLIETWKKIIDFETQKKDLLAERVILQAEVIQLQNDQTESDKKNIQEKIRRSQEINELALVLTKKIDGLYNEIEWVPE